ncbi:hypothetical protein [Schleiferilactobacillus harbinensis]|uniref:hypothetical protein n=1 Tax=Schleiferilactobacillus harbinensis TaxID=304207 RepID=UPI0039E7F83B
MGISKYDDLTNDAKFLLLELSKKYQDAVLNHQDKREAVVMGSDQSIHDGIMPKWTLSDVKFMLGELDKAGFISVIYGNNQYQCVELTTTAISWREQKFGNDTKKIIKAISDVKSLIPFF